MTIPSLTLALPALSPEKANIETLKGNLWKDEIVHISRTTYPELKFSYIITGSGEIIALRNKSAKVLPDGTKVKGHNHTLLDEGTHTEIYKTRGPDSFFSPYVCRKYKVGAMHYNPDAIKNARLYRNIPLVVCGEHLSYPSECSKHPGRIIHAQIMPRMRGSLEDLRIKLFWYSCVQNIVILKIMLKVSLCVKALHDINVAHLDIKTENFLYSGSIKKLKTLVINICDLDFAAKIKKNERVTRGSLYCADVNIYSGECIGPKSALKADIFSLSIVFWKLLHLREENAFVQKLRSYNSYTYKDFYKWGLDKPGAKNSQTWLVHKMCNPQYPLKRPNINKVIAVLKGLIRESKGAR